jgi:hypothetical protein
MKTGAGVSVGVEMLLEAELVMADVETGVEVGVEEATAGVDEEESFAVLLVHTLELVGAGTGSGLSTVAVTSWVTVSPGLTTSTVLVVSIVEVAVEGAAVEESPPTLTTA